MKERNPEQILQPNEISAGRILYLTKNPELIQEQLNGLTNNDYRYEALLDNVSTDVIFPNIAALSYFGQDEHLGKHVLTGFKNVIYPGDIAGLFGNFQTLVAGESFARGSSRIHAPLALKEAGIKIIIAKTERIFEENCVNTGIFIVDPKSKQAEELLNGQSVPVEDLLNNLSDMSKGVIKSGGLLNYFKNIEQNKLSIPECKTPQRPMTIAEKILAQNANLLAVKPGDEIIATPNKYYGYELQSPPMVKALKEFSGNKITAKNPAKLHLYSDHTALLWDDNSKTLRKAQEVFGKSLNINVFEPNIKDGTSAICHTDMVEKHALPGDLILGNDSHTDTLGVLNCLAIGKGAIDLAGAIAFDKMITQVPESIKINLIGKLNPNVSMKDFMLQFGSSELLKNEKIGSGKVFEFGGTSLDEISFDEQLKLTNMSIELLGFSGVVEPNKQIIEYLKLKRGLSEEEINKLFVYPDKDAEYSHIFNIDLSTIEPTVSEPGDTQNGKPLSEIKQQHIKVQKAYVGSCTHGTVEDLKQASEVLKGRKVSKGVSLFVQASSIDNLEEAKQKGYIQDLIDAGAKILPIGCGACMNAGEGSTEKGEIGIFATNRNFPGRTGKGEAYLASARITAASAVLGFITGPEDLP